MLVIVTFLICLFCIIEVAAFLIPMFYNGSVSQYTPTRFLRENELTLFKRLYPKETFKKEVYAFRTAFTYHEIIGGAYNGSYDYYMVGNIKVHNELLTVEDRNVFISQGNDGVYELVQGKRKFYLISANDIHLLERWQLQCDEANTWYKGITSKQLAEQGIRILGQRVASAVENEASNNIFCRSICSSEALSNCFSYIIVLAALILYMCYGNVWCLLGFVVCNFLALWAVLRWYFFKHNPLNIINLLDGRLVLDKQERTLWVGNRPFYIEMDDMLKAIENANLQGKEHVVEVVGTSQSGIVISVAGVCSLAELWSKKPPFKESNSLGVTCVALLIFTVLFSIDFESKWDVFWQNNESWFTNIVYNIPWLVKIDLFFIVFLAILSLLMLVLYVRNKLFYATSFTDEDS